MTRLLLVKASAYEVHFGPESAYLSESIRQALEKGAWKVDRKKEKLGTAVECIPEGYSVLKISEEASVCVNVLLLIPALIIP